MPFVWRKRWFLLLFPLLLAATVWHIRVETDLNAFFTASDTEDSKLLSGLLQSGELSRRYMLVVEKNAIQNDVHQNNYEEPSGLSLSKAGAGGSTSSPRTETGLPEQPGSPSNPV